VSAVADEERLARAALARVLEPGYRGTWEAVATYGAPAVWAALRAGGPVPVLSPQRVAAARHRAQGYAPERDLEALAKLGGRLVCPGDDEWPGERLTWPLGLLAHGEPPLSLHVRGQHRLRQTVERSVAVVGARAASAYGVTAAGELSLGLAERGWTVVSGAADGIDGAAHTGALAAAQGAPTVAVLAGGLDRPYPAGHAGLLRRIASTGLVVSEQPVGSAPMRSRFLVRNRLIAALTRGTLVVEASTRSGSKSTASMAADLDRHVMAVPGAITSAGAALPNELLRNGAICITRAADVVAQIGPMDAAAEERRVGEHRPRDDLSAVARQVLDAVPVRRAAGLSSIARAAGVSPLVAQQVLPPLVLHGLVEHKPDGFRLTALGAGRPARAPSA
jgi:DNA processing protein